VQNLAPASFRNSGRGFSLLTINLPVRDDLQCGSYLLDLSLHRRSHARHCLGYGALDGWGFSM
jgi:hypothetical protein